MGKDQSLEDLLGTVIRTVSRPGPQGGIAARTPSPSPRIEPDETREGNPAGDSGEPAAESAPAHVYVPTRPYQDKATPGPQEVSFELRRLGDGSAGLAIYTELAHLVAQLGDFQPWVKVSVLELIVQLSRLTERVPVAVNPVLEEGASRWTETDLADWRDF